MIDSIDSLSPTISKEWIALILLPTVGSLAGQHPRLKWLPYNSDDALHNQSA